MDRVHVEGLQKTKNDIIVPEVQKILEAQTFGEVHTTLLQALAMHIYFVKMLLKLYMIDCIYKSVIM